MQQQLIPWSPKFDGAVGIDGPEDHQRLARQLANVRQLMRDGQWRTLREIAEAVKAPEASVSARLRDLRKGPHGGYTIERQSRGRGLFAYRMVV